MTITATIHDGSAPRLSYEDAVFHMSHGTFSQLGACMRLTGMLALSRMSPSADYLYAYDEYRGGLCERTLSDEVYERRTWKTWFEETGKVNPTRWRPHSPDPGTGLDMPLSGIAAHKVGGSNSCFWWVTKVECVEALEAWRGAVLAACPMWDPAEVQKFTLALLSGVSGAQSDSSGCIIVRSGTDQELLVVWKQWLRFLRRAADAEGFEVH
jgi:hypothetical protein